MSDKLWLFIVVGKATLITILVLFGLVLGVLGFKTGMTSGEQQILKATVVFLLVLLPAGIATWWIFRKLQSHYTRREARAVATAFAVFTPVSLAVAMVLSPIGGGYAAFLGRASGPVGAFVGIVVMATIPNFLVCLFTLSMTRQVVKLESTQN
jgi:fumarate reductase subunit C